jgi:predicted DNA-binding transcriptional regulator AlpA
METNDTYLRIKAVRKRYGDVSEMTINRWVEDKEMEFPRPDYFGRCRFWKLADLEAWERSPRKEKRPAGAVADTTSTIPAAPKKTPRRREQPAVEEVTA